MKLSLLSLLSSLYLACSLIKANPKEERRMQSILYLACQKCDYDTVNAIITQYPSINPYDILSVEGWGRDWERSPAQVAEANNCRNIVTYFDTVRYNGLVKLYYACQTGDFEKVKFLREQQPWIDPNGKIEFNDGKFYSPLQMAWHSGFREIADYLRDQAYDNYQSNEEDYYAAAATAAVPDDDEDF